VLTYFDEQGRPTIQEVVEGKDKRRSKRLFLSADGQVSAQCVDSTGDGRLDARLVVKGGAIVEVLYDTTGNGTADQREVYDDGKRARLDADTTGNRKPDVIQYYAGDAVARQDEDHDGDGVVDVRFEGDESVPVIGAEKIPRGRFGKLECGRFSRFWAKR
jgi:hypothetical protein